MTESPAGGVIVVRGARTHNLADVTVTIPRGKLVAICGPSGAGKSSLAFDTVYAEAQRRYLEALGDVQGISRLPRADVDLVEGLPAAVAVAQRGLGRSSRSTLATATEISDVLRVLYARIGAARCPVCGRPLTAQTAQEIVDVLLARPSGTKLTVLAPVVRARALDTSPLLARLVAEGFVRARLDGALIELASPPEIDAHKPHDLEVVIDRVVTKEGVRARLADSVELGLRLGDGRLRVVCDAEEVVPFASRLVCAHDEGSLPPLTPALFSFNHPDGACARCGGLGTIGAPRDPDEREDAEPGLNEATALGTCPDCRGSRLSLSARCVSLSGLSLDALLSLSLRECRAHLAGVVVAPALERAMKPLIDLALARLDALLGLGLGHLELGRSTVALSAGERMRARLATAVGAGLCGVLYVLDEPSVGQSPSEVEQLAALLRALVAQGNDVLVVDHDLGLLRAADHVIDVGERAGKGGGRVVAEGPPATLGGVTGPWLSGARQLPEVAPARPREGRFSVRGATDANLRSVDLDLPIGTLIALTGPSGSGKSALLGAIARSHSAVAVRVDDAPLGRTARASAATALGVLPRLRELYAMLPEAKARGYKAGRFSLHARGGRCEACLGEGQTRVELGLLPDVRVPCAVCHGARYDRETLEVRYRGASMGDVLAMSIDDAQRLFESFPKVRAPLDALRGVGLGYLALGQPSPTLSGGEAQRVKLARGLAQGKSGRGTLWLLDEPTVGLHPSDTAVLLEALVALRDQGDTVVFAEHDPALVARADLVVEMGPGAGPNGGRVVATRRRA